MTIDEERQALDRQRRDLEYDREAFQRKVESEERRLERESELFEMKFKLLEEELARLASEKEQLERQKEFYLRVGEFNKPKDEPKVIRGELFFSGVENKQTLKKRYKDLIKIYHPDNMGGDDYTVREINREYDQLVKMYG